MPFERSRLAHVLAEIGVIVSGIMLAVFPVALWVAWTPFVFGVVCAVGIGNAVLLLALLSRRPHSREDHGAPREPGPKTVLPGEFVEEIHRIFPLTYHHSRRGRAPFRRAMTTLRRMLD